MRPIGFACLIALLVGALAAPPARAQEANELAKKLSNPISNLVSVPIQFNWEFGEGPDEDTWEITNLQPVVPIALSISRGVPF